MWGIGNRLNKLKEAAAAAADLNSLQGRDSDDDDTPKPSAEETALPNKVADSVQVMEQEEPAESANEIATVEKPASLSTSIPRDVDDHIDINQSSNGEETVADEWGWGDDNDPKMESTPTPNLPIPNPPTPISMNVEMQDQPLEPSPKAAPAPTTSGNGGGGGFFGGFSASSFAPTFNLDAMQAQSDSNNDSKKNRTEPIASGMSSMEKEGAAVAPEMEAQSAANLKQELAEAQDTLTAEVAQRRAFQEMVRQSAEAQVLD